jgi:hypothetical protein
VAGAGRDEAKLRILWCAWNFSIAPVTMDTSLLIPLPKLNPPFPILHVRLVKGTPSPLAPTKPPSPSFIAQRLLPNAGTLYWRVRSDRSAKLIKVHIILFRLSDLKSPKN